ncbi:DUF732 domain-containing protein [Mycobacterium adipatum]|uniref:DUF732 domain-containing protein n=1 Tax=Mycobacterium adipatum TaxID=1682113 RepID=UPI0034E0BD96
MFSSRITTFAAITVTAGALSLAATGTASALPLAPLAPALDSTDVTFLDSIYAEGISYPSDVHAIDDAFLVCDYLAAGRNGTDISTEIMVNSDLSPHQAATIVVEASAAYCPHYFDQVVA